MFKFIRNYWDIVSGIAVGFLFSCIAEFKLDKVQLIYSVIILVLVCVGAFRIIRQSAEKKQKKRKHTIIDSMVDGQKTIKALKLSESPTKEGEKVGKLIIILFTEGVKVMKNFIEKSKIFFSKFKGFMLTIALAILTAVEMCGGFINSLFGDVLVVKGIEVVPFVTLALVMVVGCLSNGFTKEQREKIKALFSKSTTRELIKNEIKKTLKEKTVQLAQFNKALATEENELANFASELETLENTLQAKKEMYAMIPQLATEADVQLAANAVAECKDKIAAKKEDKKKTEEQINALTTAIGALKSQL